jgi:hypothetical protein
MALRQVGPQVDTTRLGPVRMWRDDLEVVERLVREASDGDGLTIEAKARRIEFTLDNIQDLGELPDKRVDRIEIRSEDGRILVILGNAEDVVTLRDANMTTRGLANELMKLAKKRRLFRVFHWIYGSMLRTAIVMILGFGSSIALVSLSQDGPTSWMLVPSNPSQWLFLAFCLVMLLVFLFRVRPERSRLYVKSRLELPPFWARKRDDIAINIVALLIGGIIGYLVNMIS